MSLSEGLTSNMVWRLAFLLLLMAAQTAYSQFNMRLRYAYLTPSDQVIMPKSLVASRTPSTNFITKPVLNVVNYATPWLGLAPASTSRQGNLPFWIGSVRTQKMGRFGTDHFFDMTGNLRNSSTFWDIRSKSNKGFKLYFSAR